MSSTSWTTHREPGFVFSQGHRMQCLQRGRLQKEVAEIYSQRSEQDSWNMVASLLQASVLKHLT